MSARDVIIIGSGPAGLTAAVYAARANLAPLVIEGEPSSTSDQPGGQLMLTTEVENYPGFPEGIMGPDLMMRFRDQAQRFGAEYLTAKATAVDFTSRPFQVWVGAERHEADSVIVSTGAQSLMLGLEAESRLLGHGLSTCATCDGFFFRGQEIAVVGGGDSALEEALFLTKFATKVTVIHRRDSLRASKIMQERAMANERISFRWNTVVTDLVGEESLSGVRVQDVLTGEESELPLTGLFVAIGHRPNTDLFKGVLDMDDAGYLRHPPGVDLHQHRRRVRLRRRAGPHLPPGHHRRRVGMHGRHRHRALAGGHPPRLTATGRSDRRRVGASVTQDAACQEYRAPARGCPSRYDLRKERSPMAHGIQTLSTNTFDEVIGSAETPVVVDFWAEWCGPCKMIAPILEELATEQAGTITVAKLNVDENPDLAMRYNVMSIPTLLVFKDGEIAKRLVGAKPKSALLQELSEFLPAAL